MSSDLPQLPLLYIRPSFALPPPLDLPIPSVALPTFQYPSICPSICPSHQKSMYIRHRADHMTPTLG